MAKPPSAGSILKNFKKQKFEPKTPIAADMFIPNSSGVESFSKLKRILNWFVEKLFADHIGERTAGHTIVLDNNLYTTKNIIAGNINCRNMTIEINLIAESTSHFGSAGQLVIDSSGNLITTGDITAGNIDFRIGGILSWIRGSKLYEQDTGDGDPADRMFYQPHGDLFAVLNEAGTKYCVEFKCKAAMIDADSVFKLYDARGAGTGAERLRLTAIGKLGLGTTNPLEKFHMAGANPGLWIQHDTVNEALSGHLDFTENQNAFGAAGGFGFRIRLNGATNKFIIQSGSNATVTDRLSIARDTGDVAITGFLDAASYKVSGAAGASGTFTTVDGKTVTVVNGIITSIV